MLKHWKLGDRAECLHCSYPIELVEVRALNGQKVTEWQHHHPAQGRRKEMYLRTCTVSPSATPKEDS